MTNSLNQILNSIQLPLKKKALILYGGKNLIDKVLNVDYFNKRTL